MAALVRREAALMFQPARYILMKPKLDAEDTYAKQYLVQLRDFTSDRMPLF